MNPGTAKEDEDQDINDDDGQVLDLLYANIPHLNGQGFTSSVVFDALSDSQRPAPYLEDSSSTSFAMLSKTFFSKPPTSIAEEALESVELIPEGREVDDAGGVALGSVGDAVCISEVVYESVVLDNLPFWIAGEKECKEKKAQNQACYTGSRRMLVSTSRFEVTPFGEQTVSKPLRLALTGIFGDEDEEGDQDSDESKRERRETMWKWNLNKNKNNTEPLVVSFQKQPRNVSIGVKKTSGEEGFRFDDVTIGLFGNKKTLREPLNPVLRMIMPVSFGAAVHMHTVFPNNETTFSVADQNVGPQACCCFATI
eukprot:g13715.t1